MAEARGCPGRVNWSNSRGSEDRNAKKETPLEEK